MAQHDFVIDNSTGQNVRLDINNVLKAILTNNSGTTDPATVIAGAAGSKAFSFWADTNSSPAVLKIRNAEDTGWIELFQLDGTLTLEDGSASTPALANRGDLDTGVFFSAANTFNVATGGVERLELSGSSTIFNESGADVDFRIEGDTEANLFYVDAGNDRIGIGTTTPDTILEITDNGTEPRLVRIHNSSTNGSAIQFTNTDTGNSTNQGLYVGLDAAGHGNFYHQSNFALIFATNNSEGMRLDTSGRLLLGTTTEGSANADDLTIATSTDTGMTIRSGTSSAGSIFFSDATSGNAEFAGFIQYIHSNNSLGLGTDETTRMVINNTGDVGIGTTSPSTLLQIESTDPTFRIKRSDGSAYGEVTADTSGLISFKSDPGGAANGSGFIFTVDNSEKARIDSSGSLLIGGTSSIAADQKLQVFDDTDCRMNIANTTAASSQNATLFFSPANSVVGSQITCTSEEDFSTSANRTARLTFSTRKDGTLAERMRISSDGNVFIGTTTVNPGFGTNSDPGNYFSHDGLAMHSRDNGTALFIARNDSTGSLVSFNYNGGGQIADITTNGSSVSYGTGSDYRLKENITTLTNAITRLKNLKPSRFNFLTTPSLTQDGFIAHEVQEVVPEAVFGEKDAVATEKDINSGYKVGDIKAQQLDQSKLVPLLVAAVQELIGKVEALEAA